MSRGAIILLDPEIAPDAIRLISDHGLHIECSLDGRDNGLGGKIALVLTGDQLPDECESASPACVVNILCTTEAYGSQRLTRISKIQVDTYATELFQRAAAILASR